MVLSTFAFAWLQIQRHWSRVPAPIAPRSLLPQPRWPNEPDFEALFLGLINQVLNYARLEAGTVQYDITRVPLDEVVTSAASLIAPQAGAKGLTLNVGRPARIAARADADKVRQIMLNLLSNAVKYTSRGGHFGIASERRSDHVRVLVRDTGLGVPQDKLETIFEPFVQLNRALNRPAEGTGLGLAISRDLARWMGDDLTVESQEGVESTFTLSLPSAA